MTGSLNDILPEPISEQNEEILMDLLKLKIRTAAEIAVQLLRAMEERFGPEARDVVYEMARNYAVAPRSETGEPAADLHDFCDHLEKACVGSHRWRRIVDEPDRIAYHFNRCVWAEVFRELGEPALGLVLCASDEPAVKAYNPQLGFNRTQVLMMGDDICDHIFYVER